MEELDEIKRRLTELLADIEVMSCDVRATARAIAPQMIHEALAAKFVEVSKNSDLPVSQDIEKQNILTAISVIKELYPERPKITINYQKPTFE